MPSTTPKQHHFMEAIAHNSDFAAKVGVPQSVGNDFVNADQAAGKFQPKHSKIGALVSSKVAKRKKSPQYPPLPPGR